MGQKEVGDFLDAHPEEVFSLNQIIHALGQNPRTTSKNLKMLIKRKEYYVKLVFKQTQNYKGYVRMYGRK